MNNRTYIIHMHVIQLHVTRILYILYILNICIYRERTSRFEKDPKNLENLKEIIILIKKSIDTGSGKNRGIGRNASFLHTTKRG